MQRRVFCTYGHMMTQTCLQMLRCRVDRAVGAVSAVAAVVVRIATSAPIGVPIATPVPIALTVTGLAGALALERRQMVL